MTYPTVIEKPVKLAAVERDSFIDEFGAAPSSRAAGSAPPQRTQPQGERR